MCIRDRKRNSDSYRHLGQPRRWSRGRSGLFCWHLDALPPSVALERMTIGRLTQALVVAVAVVPRSAAESRGTIPSAPRPRPSGRSVSYTHLRAHETVLDLVCR